MKWLIAVYIPMELYGSGVNGRMTGLGSRSMMTLFHTELRWTHATSSGGKSVSVSG